MDAAAAAWAADAMRRASASLARAAKAFKRSSRLAGSATPEEVKVIAWFTMAGDKRRTTLAIDRSTKTSGQVGSDARTATAVQHDARALAHDADVLTGCVSKRAGAGRKRDGDHGARELARADMWDDVRRDGARSAAMLGRAVDTAGAAGRAQRLAAAAARKSAEAVSGARKDPGVQGAVAEWDKAVSAANASEAEAKGATGGVRNVRQR